MSKKIDYEKLTPTEQKEAVLAEMADIKKFWKNFFKIGSIVLAAVVALIVITIAWFAFNDTVNSNNTQVSAETSPNLVISKYKNQDGYDCINDADYISKENCFSTVFSESGFKLLPATHNWTIGTATGLVYNSNPSKVGSTTGVAADDSEPLEFTAVPVYGGSASENRYYYVYKVYIASAYKELNVSSFSATIEQTGSSDLQDYFKAASIDFYIREEDADTSEDPNSEEYYQGTLNLAENPRAKDASSDNVDGYTITFPDVTKIPLNTEGDFVVYMVFYMDGALLDNEGYAYIRTSDISIDKKEDFGIKITFDAVEQ